MNYFAIFMVILGLSLITSGGLQTQINDLKRKLKDKEIDSIPIRNILKEKIGAEIKLELFEDNYNLIAYKTILIDVDDRFVLLEVHKKKEVLRYLYRIEDIKSVEVNKEKAMD